MPLRPEDELQEAHDMLNAVLRDEIELDLPPDQEHRLAVATNVLCWALYHDHTGAAAFGDTLLALKALAERRGYIAIKPLGEG